MGAHNELNGLILRQQIAQIARIVFFHAEGENYYHAEAQRALSVAQRNMYNKEEKVTYRPPSPQS